MEPSSLFMRACGPGRHFFAYFLVAADKKVSRHQAKQLVNEIILIKSIFLHISKIDSHHQYKTESLTIQIKAPLIQLD